jgi:transcriptional regulator with XRE-family HTH domain
MKTIGDRIKQYRELAGMTQDDLGKAIGVTGSNISQIESNTRELRLDKANAICKALNVTLEQILEQ